MMTQNADKKRNQIQMFCMDDMVPRNHLLRMIENTIDWSFIYDLVEDKYCHDNGRPSMDPVMLIKILKKLARISFRKGGNNPYFTKCIYFFTKNFVLERKPA